MANKGFLDTDGIENIMEKGEIPHFEQFHLFPQCFPKALFFIVLKCVYMEERANDSSRARKFDIAQAKDRVRVRCKSFVNTSTNTIDYSKIFLLLYTDLEL